MATLTVTERGQVTFRKDILKHLGIQPGEKIEVELLAGNKLTVRKAHSEGSVENFIGILAGKTKVVATIEEINETIRKGWAGEL